MSAGWPPLAKHARATTFSVPSDLPNLDFCNVFWGVGDCGVDVLFRHMRSAVRTMEELHNFWKERSTIEEEYAKRLAELARMSIGKDEIWELRNSIDVLRLETEKQAGFHSQLAQRIQTALENQVSAFVSKQQQHMNLYQAAIEKEFEVKQTREQNTRRARERYESDCLRINSYMAQSTFMQGIDLQKIRLKLDRAQQTVRVNENEYAQCVGVLQETVRRWEHDWKAFCDMCQDQEEERIEFTKSNVWAYANAVAMTCVVDAESSERLRLTSEQLEPKKDLEDFARDYGTGNEIPEPPVFVSYANTDAPPVPSTQIATRPADFVRYSRRTSRVIAPQQNGDMITGVGAIGSGDPSHSIPTDMASLSRNGTQKSTAGPSSTVNGVNGYTLSTRDPQRRQSVTAAPARPVSGGDPVDPIVPSTQLVIGDGTWDVDPSKDTQQQVTTQTRVSPPVGEQDPLVKQMTELSTVTVASEHGRRDTIRRGGSPSPVESHKGAGDSLLTPSTGTSASAAPHGFRNPAEVDVESHPLARAPSLLTSPNSPMAVLVAPPPPSIPPSTSNVPTEQVAGGYRHPFPGEPRGQADTYIGPVSPIVNQNVEQNVPSPTSGGGHPGVGAQLFVPPPPPPAGGPNATAAVQPYNEGPPVPPAPPSNSGLHRGTSVSHRPVASTNPVGIALGPDGRVLHDSMAQQPVRQGSLYSQPGPPPPQSTQPPQPQLPLQPTQPSESQPHSLYHDSNRTLTQRQRQRSPSRNDSAVVAPSAHGGSQPYNYGHSAQRPGYRDESQVQGHGQAPQSNHEGYGLVTQPEYHQQSQSVDRAAPNATQQKYEGNTSAPRSTSAGVRKSPSSAVPRGQPPPPTGTYTDSGRPILFYVKALYDYNATIDEEFDFQVGDIIAVTETPSDGWWSGELLDDSRRQAGRHVFPSNFVCLF